ncbi:hypothetical protein N7501_010941 [Penicillium viridicatum]|nr:hypothetical protein N7501_010941 [Penicillium viridicatum]
MAPDDAVIWSALLCLIAPVAFMNDVRTDPVMKKNISCCPPHRSPQALVPLSVSWSISPLSPRSIIWVRDTFQLRYRAL